MIARCKYSILCFVLPKASGGLMEGNWIDEVDTGSWTNLMGLCPNPRDSYVLMLFQYHRDDSFYHFLTVSITFMIL